MSAFDQRRVPRILTLLVALAVFATACPGDTTDTTTGGTEGPTETEAPGETSPPDESTTTGAATGEIVNPGLYVHAADDEPLSVDPAPVAAGGAGASGIAPGHAVCGGGWRAGA